MLKLSQQKPVFTGGSRFCYVYPGDPDKCIKVVQSHRTGAVRKKEERSIKNYGSTKRMLERSLRKYRPADAFDVQIKEIKAYRRLARQKNPRIWDHIPEYFGTEETDMGLGVITRLYRNHDGSYPPTLRDLVNIGIPPERAAGLAVGIEEFKNWLQDELVITHNLVLHNIIAVSHEDGRQQVVFVDGLGNSEFVPISTWFKPFARRKIQRKLARFQHDINDLCPN